MSRLKIIEDISPPPQTVYCACRERKFVQIIYGNFVSCGLIGLHRIRCDMACSGSEMFSACLYGELKSMDSIQCCVHLSIPCTYQLSEEYVNCGIRFGVLHCYCLQCQFTDLSLYHPIALLQTCVRVLTINTTFRRTQAIMLLCINRCDWIYAAA